MIKEEILKFIYSNNANLGQSYLSTIEILASIFFALADMVISTDPNALLNSAVPTAASSTSILVSNFLIFE